MVQKLKIEELCDFCYNDDDKETLADHSETLGLGISILELQWCEKHNNKFKTITEMIEAFREYGHEPQDLQAASTGRRQQKPRSDEGVYECPFNNCSKTYRRKSYMEGHIAWHNGDPGYGCNQPDCTESFDTYQALGLHKDRKHGIPSPFKHLSLEKRTKAMDADKAEARQLALSRA